MAELNWDHSNVREVAALLIRMNPSFCFRTVEDGIAAIKHRVESAITTPGYLSTYGFCATVWADENYRYHVKITLEPYTVQRFLDSQSAA